MTTPIIVALAAKSVLLAITPATPTTVKNSAVQNFLLVKSSLSPAKQTIENSVIQNIEDLLSSIIKPGFM